MACSGNARFWLGIRGAAKDRIPYGILAGAASPIPWGQAARSTAELCSRAFLEVIPAAGHFVWVEAPSAVRAALERITEVI
jgi:pimeloyl-ACP methyl ester carboxylesterase